MKYFSQSLKNVPNLILIDLGDNKIGDDGLIELCKNFKYVRKLSSLNLGGINIIIKNVELVMKE